MKPAPEKLPLELSDEVLMRMYQQGDAAAFDELYRRHAPKVYGYLYSRASSRQQADDLLQACFLKLHQSRHLYDSSREFLPWLWSILRSTFSDSLRSDLRNPARANSSEQSARDHWESIPMASDEQQSALSIAAELLEGLPEDQKQLIEMRTKQGLSFEEIASRLSISSAAARQRFSRLVQSLKGKLS